MTADAPEHRVPARAAALVGILAVAAALGVAHLVAAVVQPPSSPFLAVGRSFIDLTPAWLKDFAVATFGVHDKVALLGGMALVGLALGALVGLLARRDLGLGVVAVVVLGLVGLVAVLSRPDTTVVAGVVAPLLSLPVGVGVLVLLLRAADTAWPAVPPRTPRGTALAVSRRGFLGTSAAVAVGTGAAALVGQGVQPRVDVAAAQASVGTLTAADPVAALPAGVDFAAAGGLAFTTANADFYRIDTALRPPQLSAASWTLRIHGMVDREITLDMAALLAREVVERRVTFACVSYDLGSDLVGNATWAGVDLAAILQEAGVQDGAEQLFSTSVDGFTASTPVDVVMEPGRGAMLAVNMNGEPLPVEHGFPVRMLVPGLYGFVSATKWITDIELTTYAAKQAYWTPRGWSDHGPVKMASKVVSGTSTASGAGFTATVTGAAWAMPAGITRVEVQVDDGAWQDARLGAAVSADTWRMFKADLTGLTAGEHTVRCRATDDTGRVQTQETAPPAPDGATGWHTVRLNVG